MALLTKTGSFLQPGSTGNQSVTGIGFTPKLVIFFGNELTTSGSVADTNSYFGTATSSSDRRVSQASEPDGISTSPTGQLTDMSHTNLKCIRITNGDSTNTIQAEADLVSMDATGFTLNWTTADANARIINYMAIGGTDITNVQTGATAMITGTGNASITGMGFKPDFMMFWIHRVDITDPAIDSNASITASFGFSDGVNQATSAWRDAYLNPDREFSFQQSNRIFVGVSATPGTFAELDLVSFDTDGFTYNADVAAGSAYFFYWLAIKGGKWRVGTFNQKTSTGDQSVSGLPLQPTGLILSSVNAVTTTGAFVGTGRSFGVTDGTSMNSIWQGAVDNVSTTNTSQNLDRSNVIRMMTAAHASPTTQANASIKSFDLTGFTLNWGTADATAREIVYLAMGSTIASNPNAIYVGDKTSQPNIRYNIQMV